MSERAEPVTIVYVDPTSEAERVDEYLSEIGGHDVIHEPNVARTLDVLEDDEADCLVTRARVDGQNGLERLEGLSTREALADVPLVLFARDGSSELASHALDRGGIEYVIDTGAEESLAVLERRIVTVVDADPTSAVETEAIEPRFHDLAESINVGILTIDTDSVIRYVNPAVATILGYEPTELRGESLSLLIPDRLQRAHFDGLESYLQTGRRNVEWDGVELHAAHAAGHDLPVRIAFGEFTHGDERYFTGTITDLSAAERRKSELKRQNERLERFASVVSHDLRNPLSVAQGQLDLARNDVDLERLDHVADAHQRMARLIDDLLALARHGEDVESVEPLSLQVAATDAWETVETAGATLEVVDDMTLAADRSRLRQLFENLFSNAIEHGSDGVPAELTVRVGPTQDGFFIEDDGVGIDPDVREYIFESGMTTTDHGTGFGLAIVAEICAAHGWKIDVSDSAARGTHVAITEVDAGP